MIIKEHQNVIDELLKIEHQSIAQKLNFISIETPSISDELLNKSVGVIDYYSRKNDDVSKQIVIVLSSILHNYKKQNWDGLTQFLIVVLSRIGFSPSAIMVDDNFDFENNKFSSLNSLISEITTSIYQLNNEILIKDKTYLLTDFQKKIFEKCSTSKFIGISAPTSAGKSFIILLKSIDNILKEGGNIVYIVPTLSLITQVVNDFHKKLKEFEINNYEIQTNYSTVSNLNKIYVLTPERAISAYNEEEKPFGKVNTFIVDEIQNIERIENVNDERAKILFDSLIELSFSYDPNLIVFSGPRVTGLKTLGFDIFNNVESEEINTLSSPVTSFTYSVKKSGQKYFIKQYSQIKENYSSIEITNYQDIKIGGKQYDQKYLNYLNTVVSNLGIENKNILFSPTSETSRRIANNLIVGLKPIEKNSLLNSLIEYISNTVHPNYDLCKTLTYKTIYHHGKVPLHVRNTLEYAIKSNMIDNIVCTTTLLQGVNLPAQNVIMRNGSLGSKARNGVLPSLTNYEISNLRGRAGRLLKDFIGRTFVLDENAFDKEESNQLFKDENKSLTSGYGKIFDDNNKTINNSLIRNISNETLSVEVGNDVQFLITYIRQIILKHKGKSIERLKSVGINLSKEEINLIYEELINELEIPLEICFRNRYIDPLVLNQFYIRANEFTLPTKIINSKLSNELYKLVNQIRIKFPNYYSKYFSRELEQPFFYTVGNWANEKPLHEILNKDYFDDSNNIDKIIDTIQSDICFNLTNLLKPFYSILEVNSKLISCIEMGAYNPITLHLIHLNIPREVAIKLKNTIFINEVYEEDEFDEKIVSKIKKFYYSIDFWDRIQLEHII
jgi:replicative superfamily II helicase